MKKLMTLSIVMTTLMLVFIGQAADRSQFKVSVAVYSDDKNTISFIESHIKRELRSLRDIDVVEHDMETNDFYIRIITPGSIGRTIYIFYDVYNYFNDDDIKTLMNGEDLRGIKILLNVQLARRTYNSLLTGTTEDLDKICKEIVVDFDTKMLAPLRQR